MFGRRFSHAGHLHDAHTHPVRRRVLLTLLAAAVLAALALLITPPHARGNFVYWTNDAPGNSVGRAKINGAGLNDNFVTGLNRPIGVAVDSKFIYWADWNANRIGRANLDGTATNLNFITGVHPQGIAVTSSSGIFWGNDTGTSDTIGHAKSRQQFGHQLRQHRNEHLRDRGKRELCLLAGQHRRRTQDRPGARFGWQPRVELHIPPRQRRVRPRGGQQLPVLGGVRPWERRARASGRGTADPNFIPNTNASILFSPAPAVNSQFVFWSNPSSTPGSSAIGRANINGSSPNPSLIPAVASPNLLVAAPSNKITVNSVSKNKKKGTASINTKVPGPGQVTLNQTNTPPDVNATAAGVKQVGLTITQASSFKLAVKPTGKTAKKLSKQIKKQLKKKNKAKAKASVTVFIHFVPAGISGVPNTQQVKVTLIKQAKKKK